MPLIKKDILVSGKSSDRYRESGKENTERMGKECVCTVILTRPESKDTGEHDPSGRLFNISQFFFMQNYNTCRCSFRFYITNHIGFSFYVLKGPYSMPITQRAVFASVCCVNTTHWHLASTHLSSTVARFSATFL